MASKPTTFKRLRGHTLTSNFRAAVVIETAEMIHPAKGEVLVKNKYVGINAGEVNVTKGRYFSCGKPPINVGLEAVGEIVELGEDVKGLKVGQIVAYLNLRVTSFAEYTCIEAEKLFIIPAATPEYLALVVCGLTASIGLEKVSKIKAGETVLINAAAGATGHIAVQWAKNTGCHVIGTCSTEEKVKYLKDLGCDRVINYEMENLTDVLAKEYKNGINVIWETNGGEMYDVCFKNLSKWGKLIVIGGIAGYKTEEKSGFLKTGLLHYPEELAFKSATIKGFLVTMYGDHFASYYKVMTKMMESGKLKIRIDDGEKSTGSEFFGMEGIIRGMEHVHTKKSIGKVISRLY